MEWCESAAIIIASLAFKKVRQKLSATKFIEAVVPDVKIIFSRAGALINSLTTSLAVSYSSVALSERAYIALCTLAFVLPAISSIRESTLFGF